MSDAGMIERLAAILDQADWTGDGRASEAAGNGFRDEALRELLQELSKPTKQMVDAGAFHLIPGADSATRREMEQAQRVFVAMVTRLARDI